MTNRKASDPLIAELLSDPVAFDEQGKAYQLLQRYFQGLSTETLRPLLTHPDGLVRRSASFVATELGDQACDLLEEVIPLVHDIDPYVQWGSLETIMLCSSNRAPDKLTLVIREFENHNDSIRRLAMRLSSKANQTQLESAFRLTASLGNSRPQHERGLSILLRGDTAHDSDVKEMLGSSELVTRKYGAVAAKRLFELYPNLLQDAAQNSDSDVSRFSIEALNRM
jgi:hypothetical protein